MHDFYSDTKTKPSRAMLESALDRSFGDEQKNEDPTTKELCARVAELLGKEAAVFLPSGSMCNEIAINVHCRPGDEVICDRSSHIINFEAGAPAAMSGVMVHPLDGDHGRFTADQVRGAIRPPNRYLPLSRLLCTEQTANMGGGAIWDLGQITEVAEVAREAGLSTHMDGARLLNASVKTGIPAKDYVAAYDTCWVDFTKGLGAPVGAALAGSAEFIEAAWRVKQRIGGAMRQSGVIASFCLYALDNNVDRMAEDHALAARIAQAMGQMPGVGHILPVDTNIIIADLAADAPTAPELVDALLAEGVEIGAFGERRIRIVTHLDVDNAAGDALIAALKRHL